jgi:hypothetical protein
MQLFGDAILDVEQKVKKVQKVRPGQLKMSNILKIV